MPSAERPKQLAILAICGVLGVGSLTGCETTQEKAAAHRAESERILEARAKRHAQKKKQKHKNKDTHEKGKG